MASPNSDSYDSHVRKRVGKACDRCRLKKSKCDGMNPCSRCKADNAICVFGERKKSHDKVYPKGYVEMLEQQQSQLVAGVRTMYQKLVENEAWPGTPLHEQTEGHPLTHDILDRLNVLGMTGDSPAASGGNFEEDLETLQRQLLQRGASFAGGARGSPSTDSEPGLAHTDSPHGTPLMSSTSEMPSRQRKRHSPVTPALETAHLTVPSKRRSYMASEFVQAEFQQSEPDFPVYTDPWAAFDPNINQMPDVSSLYSYNSANLFNPELEYTTSPATWSLAETDAAGLTTTQDDELEGFRRSGYHYD